MKSFLATKSIRRLFTSCGFLISTAVLILCFQNCKGDLSVLSSSASGGGTGGFDGKSFVDYSISICPDGTFIASRIIVDAQLGTAFVVRENCLDITPRAIDIASLSLMAHNEENLINDGHVYGSEVGSGSQNEKRTALLCRKTEPDNVIDDVPESSADGQRSSDVVIYSEKVYSADNVDYWSYSASIKIGFYSPAGDLKGVRESDIPKVLALYNVDGADVVLNQPSFPIKRAVIWGGIDYPTPRTISDFTLYLDVVDGKLKARIFGFLFYSEKSNHGPYEWPVEPPKIIRDWSLFPNLVRPFTADCYVP